jgi:hypothetical protein
VSVSKDQSFITSEACVIEPAMVGALHRRAIYQPLKFGAFKPEHQPKRREAEDYISFETGIGHNSGTVTLDAVEDRWPLKLGISTLDVQAKSGGGEVYLVLETSLGHNCVLTAPNAVEAHRACEDGIVTFDMMAERGGDEIHGVFIR